MLLREAKSLPTNRLFMWKLVMKSLLLIAAVVLLVGALPSKFEATLLGADNPPTPQESVKFFKDKVRPIFANICSNCHGDAATSGLRVDSRELLLKGGSRGPAIVPNDPDKSLMIQAVRQTGELKMPKGGKLTPEEVQSLTEWVKMGAPWPRSKPTLTAARGTQFKISPEQRSFWSFQPLKMPATPSLKNVHWGKTAIDKFVLAKLESQGIAPSPTADRRPLIRRATFALTGLAPTTEDIEAFAQGPSPQ